MNWIALVAFIFFSLDSCPLAIGQAYDYSYGNSRVVIESRNGRSNPSSTYIGPGTASKSAQGIIQYGAQVNPGLPKVNRGNYIGTPGDNLYTMTPLLTQQPKQANPPQDNKFTYKAPLKKPLETYVRDPNVPMTYADFQTQSYTHPQKQVVTTVDNAPRHN